MPIHAHFTLIPEYLPSATNLNRMQINGQDNGYVVFTPKQCLFENKSFAYLNDRSTKIRKGKMAIDPACRGNLLETTEISTPELELKTKGTGIRLKAPKKD